MTQNEPELPNDRASTSNAREVSRTPSKTQPIIRFSLGTLILGRSPALRRLVVFWASTASVYLLAGLLLWILVIADEIAPTVAITFAACLASGVCFFYLLVRFSKRLGLEPSFLTILQGMFATLAIVAAYAMSGQFRGGTISILVIMMSFCGFALSVRKSLSLSVFAVLSLGISMFWLWRIDPHGHPPLIELANFVLACGMLVAVVFLTAQWNRLRRRLKLQKLELADAFDKIQLLATNDELTRLPNRRHMNSVLRHEERRSDRSLRNVCLALIDVDHFKRINDGYGHAVGDEVLRIFARHLKEALRADDVLARWGGEEFLLLLSHTTEESALLILSRIQTRFSSITVNSEIADLRITFSCGLTTLRPDEEIADAIKRADLAMFQAKDEGRNTIRRYSSDEEINAEKSIAHD